MSIDKDQVIWAYRAILGREPENEEVVNRYVSGESDFHALRDLFFHSEEFKSSLEKMNLNLPIDVPPMDVELNVSPEKLEKLFNKTAEQWAYLGKTEPHWSVLTNESYFQDNLKDNREVFYASGESELKIFDAILARAKISLSNKDLRCVELGCGVGRVSVPLARRFESLVAVDISQAHLDIAKHYATENNVNNITFQLLKNIDHINHIGVFDILYSRIVLQHNSPPIMEKLLRDLLTQLRSGGIAFFQIPTYKIGYRFRIDDYINHDNKTEMELHFFPQTALFELIEAQNCKVLEIREDDNIGLSISAVSNTFLIQKR